MLELVFDALEDAPNDKALRDYLVAVYRFYLAMCQCGLVIHEGDFGGYKVEPRLRGAAGVISLPNDLYLVFSVFRESQHPTELELATQNTENRLAVSPVKDGWKLTFLRDEDQAHPVYERLAALYGVDGSRQSVTLDIARFRGFLRELSELSRPCPSGSGLK
ncbi:MAG TPA: hypothetical protein VMU11_00605 [Verrucomicrobiae bacterium]|nr:hypothetical protein [Verrucomicrobiae bacterium]